MENANFTDHFLIAMPSMVDPYFAKSLTYVCEHNEQGALGVVVNRPIDMTLQALFERLSLKLAHKDLSDAPIYFGGPVQTDRGFVLHEPTGNWQSTLKVRDAIGLTTSKDILEAVGRGVDMFDCVLPTRAGRHGVAYTRWGRLNLKNARHADDPAPLDPQSDCPASRDYSRAYLHHLVKSNELLGAMLLTWNNLAYYQALMAGVRAAIAAGTYGDFVAATKAEWAAGDIG